MVRAAVITAATVGLLAWGLTACSTPPAKTQLATSGELVHSNFVTIANGSDLTIHALALIGTTDDGDEFYGRCPTCVKEGLRSTVTGGGYGMCTAVYCGSGHYDEDGYFHFPPNCNTCTTSFVCSEGHEFSVSTPSQ